MRWLIASLRATIHQITYSLLPSPSGGRRDSAGVSDLVAVGMDAAVAAMGYMEWSCSVGLVAIYAEVRLYAGGLSTHRGAPFFFSSFFLKVPHTSSIPHIAQNHTLG